MKKNPTFNGIGELLRYHLYVLMRPIAFVKLMLGLGFDAKFRERIMLAVTQVNKCSFCTWYHSREALKAGLDDNEIKNLLSAEFDGVPEKQQPAILFAQHWADTHGVPDKEAEEKFQAAYTPKELKMIYLSLYFISIGNYTGGFFENIFSKKSGNADTVSVTTEKK
jgi:AhpD family alkylhydroperoxidase